jgi:hypothetical protein
VTARLRYSRGVCCVLCETPHTHDMRVRERGSLCVVGGTLVSPPPKNAKWCRVARGTLTQVPPILPKVFSLIFSPSLQPPLETGGSTTRPPPPPRARWAAAAARREPPPRRRSPRRRPRPRLRAAEEEAEERKGAAPPHLHPQHQQKMPLPPRRIRMPSPPRPPPQPGTPSVGLHSLPSHSRGVAGWLRGDYTGCHLSSTGCVDVF